MNPAIFLLNMSEPRATLLVRIPVSLKSRLAEIAKRERRSLSKQVELLLERYIEVLDTESQSAPHRREAIVENARISSNPLQKEGIPTGPRTFLADLDNRFWKHTFVFYFRKGQSPYSAWLPNRKLGSKTHKAVSGPGGRM